MSLELVNTFGTLLTVAIIAATAIAAMVQLRHLRAGNQINAMLSIGNQFDGKEFRDAGTLVSHKLDAALEDPTYREYWLAIQRRLPVPTVPEEYRQFRAAARLVGDTYEELGILVKNGIVEKGLFLDRYCYVINMAWSCMERAVAFTRAAADNDAIWENFEYLAVLSQDWMREHPSAYPKGVRRLQPHNPWPVPPMPATA
jgi:hypothetical protein